MNIKDLRNRARITLSDLSDLTGYSASQISDLESIRGGVPRMKDEIVSILLQRVEEGINIDVRIWRTRGPGGGGETLHTKNAMSGWVKNI